MFRRTTLPLEVVDRKNFVILTTDFWVFHVFDPKIGERVKLGDHLGVVGKQIFSQIERVYRKNVVFVGGVTSALNK